MVKQFKITLATLIALSFFFLAAAIFCAMGGCKTWEAGISSDTDFKNISNPPVRAEVKVGGSW